MTQLSLDAGANLSVRAMDSRAGPAQRPPRAHEVHPNAPMCLVLQQHLLRRPGSLHHLGLVIR